MTRPASSLTDYQLRSAIQSSEMTASKHEEAGNPRLAAQALARAHRNREELRRREGLIQDPPPADPEAAAETALIPNAVVPDDAVRDAEEIARKWGTTALVRACVAVLNQHTSYRDSLDITDAPRVIAMQRRIA